MARREDAEINQKASSASSISALLCFFILFVGGCCPYASDNESEARSAIEHLPLWLIPAIVVTSPLVVLARLKWGKSPWDIQSHRGEEKNQERNDQGK